MWTYNYTYPNYICHHGIKGQKWGIRRYQNENGSLTSAGKKRYSSFATKRYERKVEKYTQKAEKQEEKSKAAGNYVPSKYRRKAEEAASRAKRSQEFDDNYMREIAARPETKRFVMRALVGPFAYQSYLQQRAANVSKGKAMVNAYLFGTAAAGKARSDYINQDVKKARKQQKAIDKAEKYANRAAEIYNGMRGSISKDLRQRYQNSANKKAEQAREALKKAGVSTSDKRWTSNLNSNVISKNFDYKKDPYYVRRSRTGGY